MLKGDSRQSAVVDIAAGILVCTCRVPLQRQSGAVYAEWFRWWSGLQVRNVQAMQCYRSLISKSFYTNHSLVNGYLQLVDFTALKHVLGQNCRSCSKMELEIILKSHCELFYVTKQMYITYWVGIRTVVNGVSLTFLLDIFSIKWHVLTILSSH